MFELKRIRAICHFGTKEFLLKIKGKNNENLLSGGYVQPLKLQIRMKNFHPISLSKAVRSDLLLLSGAFLSSFFAFSSSRYGGRVRKRSK